jgi:hypothetical protein
MSKVVKKVAPIVGAVVGAFVGFATGGPAGAIRGAALGYSLGKAVQGKPSSNTQAGDPSVPDTGQLATAIGEKAWVPKAYGNRRSGCVLVATDVMNETSSGSDLYKIVGNNAAGSYSTSVYVLGEGPWEKITNVYYNNNAIFKSTADLQFGTVYSWGNDVYDTTQNFKNLQFEFIRGEKIQNRSTLLSRVYNNDNTYWFDTTDVGNGICYMVIRVKRDSQAIIRETAPALTIDGYGKRIPEIRIEGSPVQYSNATYQTGTNPALIALDQLRDDKFGLGVDDQDIDFDTFVKFANHCDNPGTYSDGTTIPPFRMHGQFNQGVSTKEILEQIALCTGALFSDENGIITVKIDKQEMAETAPSISADNIVGSITRIESTVSSSPNAINVRFYNQIGIAVTDVVEFNSTLIEAEGRKEAELELRMIQDPLLARELAKRVLYQSRQPTLEFKMNNQGYNIDVYNVARISDILGTNIITDTNDSTRIRIMNVIKERAGIEPNNAPITISAKIYNDQIYSVNPGGGTDINVIPSTYKISDSGGIGNIPAPSNVSAIAVNNGEISVSWSHLVQYTAQILYRTGGSTGDFIQLVTSSSSPANINLLASGTYDIAVRYIATDLNLGPGPLTIISYVNNGLEFQYVPVNGIEYGNDGFIASQNRYLQMRFADNQSGDGIRTSLVSQSEIQSITHSTASTSHPSVSEVLGDGYTQSVAVRIPSNFNSGTPTREYHNFTVNGTNPNFREILDPGGDNTFNIIIPKTSSTPSENGLSEIKGIFYNTTKNSGTPINNVSLVYNIIYTSSVTSNNSIIASVTITTLLTAEELISKLINSFNSRKLASTLPSDVPDISLLHDRLAGRIFIQYNNSNRSYLSDKIFLNRNGSVFGNNLIFDDGIFFSNYSYTHQNPVKSTTPSVQYIVPTLTSTSLSTGIASSSGDVLVGGTQFILYSKPSSLNFTFDPLTGNLIKDNPDPTRLEYPDIGRTRFNEKNYTYDYNTVLLGNSDGIVPIQNSLYDTNYPGTINTVTFLNTVQATRNSSFETFKTLFNSTSYDYYFCFSKDSVVDGNRIKALMEPGIPFKTPQIIGTGFVSTQSSTALLPVTPVSGNLYNTLFSALQNYYGSTYAAGTGTNLTDFPFWARKSGDGSSQLYKVYLGSSYLTTGAYITIKNGTYYSKDTTAGVHNNSYWEFYLPNCAVDNYAVQITSSRNIQKINRNSGYQTFFGSPEREDDILFSPNVPVFWNVYAYKNSQRVTSSYGLNYDNQYFNTKLIQDVNDYSGNSLNNILTKVVNLANTASIGLKGLNSSMPTFSIATVPSDANGTLAPFIGRTAIKVTGGSEQFKLNVTNSSGSGNFAIENSELSAYYRNPFTSIKQPRLTINVDSSYLTNKSFNSIVEMNLPFGSTAIDIVNYLTSRLSYIDKTIYSYLITTSDNYKIVVKTNTNELLGGSISLSNNLDANLSFTSNNNTTIPVYAGLPTIYTITDPTNTYTKTFEDFITTPNNNRLSYTINQISDWINTLVPNYDASWTPNSSSSGVLSIYSDTITNSVNNWKITVNNQIDPTNLAYGNMSFNGLNNLNEIQGNREYLSSISENVKFVKYFTFNSIKGTFVDKTLPTNLTQSFSTQANQSTAETNLDSFFSSNSIAVTKNKYTGLYSMDITFPSAIGYGTIKFIEINSTIIPKFITLSSYYYESGLVDGITPTASKGSITYGDKVFWAEINGNDYFLWNRFNANNGGWVIASDNTLLDWYYFPVAEGLRYQSDLTTLDLITKVLGTNRANLVNSFNSTSYLVTSLPVYQTNSDIVINYNFGIQDDITTNFVWYNRNNSSGDYISSFTNKGYIGTITAGGNNIGGPIKNRITLKYPDNTIIYQRDYWNYLTVVTGHTNKTLNGILNDISTYIGLSPLSWTGSDNGTTYTITVPAKGVNVPLLTGKLILTLETINPSVGTIIPSNSPNDISFGSSFTLVQDGGSLPTYYGVRSQTSSTFTNSDVKTNFLWFRIPKLVWTTGASAPTYNSVPVTLLIPTCKVYSKRIPEFEFLNTAPYPTGYNLIEQTNFVVDTDDLTLDQTSLIPTVNLGKTTSTLTGSVSVYQVSQNRFLIARSITSLNQIPTNANALTGNTIYQAHDNSINATGRTVVNLTDASTNYEPGRFYVYSSTNTTWTEVQ